ncbi:hypothetical protein IQ254_18230 [Nodosilinea sp. LEGE 07088]|uniref:hypothetical protein n=1 Tax=Nodosilinea sp. LEGE 07088 TaxID=2777968 RepID=UPI00188243DF|nr:hypothetical protein [Nodosilinea sp. LEGE 07088]MBE9139108.1 hypothetical protein [Nodosilinea sp. LEGE 07088]
MTHQSPLALERQKLDILHLFFFLLGAPHIYGALRSAERQRQQRAPVLQYLSVAMLAMAIASAAEMWLL